jgi:hypothetical protein
MDRERVEREYSFQGQSLVVGREGVARMCDRELVPLFRNIGAMRITLIRVTVACNCLLCVNRSTANHQRETW